MNNKSVTGFSLIELMIVVVIISILATIAIPSYQESVAKARRADAQGALYSLASSMERFYTQNNTYCGAEAGGVVRTCATANKAPGIHGTTVPLDGGTAYYNLTIISTTTASTFEIRAIRTGVMSADKCGDFTLSSTNVQSIINQTAGITAADCWR